MMTAGAKSLRRERSKIVPVSQRCIKQGHQLTLRCKKGCEKLGRERKWKIEISEGG